MSGSLFYRVRDSYNACFAVNDFQSNVSAIGTSAMRSLIGHFTVSPQTACPRDRVEDSYVCCNQYDEVIGDRNKINMKLHEIIGKSIYVSMNSSVVAYLMKANTTWRSNGASTVPDLRSRISDLRIAT